jgi:carboxylesterase type B
MIVYVPSNIARLVQDGPRNVPVMMWLHGGSFIQGSASDPATDGSKLAVATNSVVAVAQYRLGGVRNALYCERSSSELHSLI